MTQVWQNAITGNTGGTPKFVNGPYDPAVDFHLGYFGLDSVIHVVWAVVNHNSQFAVTNLQTVQAPSVTHLADGHLFLQFVGVPNALNNVQTSADLAPNSFVTVASSMAGPMDIVPYEGTNAGSFTRRFYRVSSP